MPRGPVSFKQRDLIRALKGARAAGEKVERAWIERDGKIALDFAKTDADADHDEQDENPWDKALAS